MKLKLLFALILLIPCAFALEGEIQLFDNGDAFLDLETEISLVGDVFLENSKLLGYTSELTNKRGSEWEFELSNSNVENYSLRIIMPRNSELISVPNGIITSERGLTVIKLEGTNLDINLKYSVPYEENSTTIYKILVVFLILVVIGFLIWKIPKHSRRINKDKIDSLKLTLNENQLKILEALIANKGEATQKKLENITNVPKSSLSRNLEIMAQKSVIEKFSNGMSNYIKLHRSLFQ